jgi:hypothetical protein
MYKRYNAIKPHKTAKNTVFSMPGDRTHKYTAYIQRACRIFSVKIAAHIFLNLSKTPELCYRQRNNKYCFLYRGLFQNLPGFGTTSTVNFILITPP